MTTGDGYDQWIRKVAVRLQPPDLKDNTADLDRLVKGMNRALDTDKVRLDYEQIQKIPVYLRKWNYRARPIVYRNGDAWHLLDLWPVEEQSGIYGLAVDLGSSTIVARLVDLSDGRILGESTFLNPQNRIGPDILTRIHYASGEGGVEALQSMLVERLNREIEALSGGKGIDPRLITAVSVAGNTTMTHFLLGLDPYWICREPYIPVANTFDLLKGRDLGLCTHPGAPVMVLPNVGSYFGGDVVAGILASGINHDEGVSLLVDVGTNAEVVLGNRDWLMGCAGAAGPALEGGVAGMGMMAGPGVIDRVVIDRDTGRFCIRTINNEPPLGICGSGLIDLTAQLYLAGMIDIRGKLSEERCGDRLLEVDGLKHLVVVPAEESGTGNDLTLNQAEIDSLIRSKAAMYAILTTITSMVGIPLRDIRRIYIAGTFGSFIDPGSAITIGMLPDLPPDAFRPLGNTSLEGATRVMLSARAKEEAYAIRDRITYVELNVNQAFMNLFSASKFIPHTDRSLFPSVTVP